MIIGKIEAALNENDGPAFGKVWAFRLFDLTRNQMVPYNHKCETKWFRF
jgi:hypothetical protein